jgi:hypothetical protein
MFTLSFLVIAVIGWFGVKKKWLKGGSLAFGILFGLLLMGTPMGQPLKDAADALSTSLGNSVKSTLMQVDTKPQATPAKPQAAR